MLLSEEPEAHASGAHLLLLLHSVALFECDPNKLTMSPALGSGFQSHNLHLTANISNAEVLDSCWWLLLAKCFFFAKCGKPEGDLSRRVSVHLALVMFGIACLFSLLLATTSSSE